MPSAAARVAGEPAGALIGRQMTGQGWVQGLGVRAAYRGRGLGRLLLQSAFAAFHRLGYPEVALSVDTENPTGAVRLCESVGMRSALSLLCWERELTGR